MMRRTNLLIISHVDHITMDKENYDKAGSREGGQKLFCQHFYDLLRH